MTQEKPNSISLMETKNQEQLVQRLRRKLKTSHSFLVNPEGLSGV